MSRVFSKILLVLLGGLLVDAQFGVNRKAEAGLDADGQQEMMMQHPDVDEAIISKLKQSNSDLTEQQAIDVAYMIYAVSQDPETQLLLSEMKSGTGRELYQDFVKEMSARDIAQGLAISLEEIRMLDYLFQDPQKAVIEMEKEGLLEDHMVKAYKNDPNLLEEDTRKSVYFSFVSLAAAGGYL
jgi:hypothetical protein